MNLKDVSKLIGQAGQFSNTVIVEFKAGKMKYQGKKVTADPRRGTVRLVRDVQGLISFRWCPAGTSNPETELTIFPGEANLQKVKQSKDRVYLLYFPGGPRYFFFWMQDSDAETDEENVKKFNDAVSGGSSATSSEPPSRPYTAPAT